MFISSEFLKAEFRLPASSGFPWRLFPAAEGPQLAGALSEGDPEAPPTYHDHDENGPHASGESASVRPAGARRLGE